MRRGSPICGCGRSSVLLLVAAAATRADAAAEDGEQDEAADAGGEADDEGLVVVDPVFYFVADGAAGALALGGCEWCGRRVGQGGLTF